MSSPSSSVMSEKSKNSSSFIFFFRVFSLFLCFWGATVTMATSGSVTVMSSEVPCFTSPLKHFTSISSTSGRAVAAGWSSFRIEVQKIGAFLRCISLYLLKAFVFVFYFLEFVCVPLYIFLTVHGCRTFDSVFFFCILYSLLHFLIFFSISLCYIVFFCIFFVCFSVFFCFTCDLRGWLSGGGPPNGTGSPLWKCN